MHLHRAVFAGFLLLAGTGAFAAGAAENVHVIQVRVDANGSGMVFFDKPIAGAPAACGQDSSYKNALAFNGTQGKGVLAVALAAKTTGATVFAYGTGVCGVYGDYVEDWAYGVSN